MPAIDYPKAIDRIAGPLSAHQTRESRIALAARHLGLPFRTVRRLYYREMTDPKVSIHLRFEPFEPAAQALTGVLSRLEKLEGVRVQ